MRLHRWPFTQLCYLCCFLAWTVDPALAESAPTRNFTATLGGSGFDAVNAMTVDSAGSIYVAGETDSLAFPSTDRRSSRDAFVAKLDSSGSTVLYVAYIGGSGADAAQAIAVDSAGNVYVAGVTSSQDFPTTAGVVGTASAGLRDAFVVKLDASGSVVYSTLLGSSGDDQALGIAVDSSGNAYITGQAGGQFPTTSAALQTTFHGGITDCFVSKLNPSGTALVYSTMLGGTGLDLCRGIAVDHSGNAYVAGMTQSYDFPVQGALQPGLIGLGNAFVAKLDANGANLVYSTFLGGSSSDQAYAISIDSSGSAYVAGNTNSVDFPVTAGAFQSTLSGSYDGFVAKLSPAGNSLVYATLIGGTGNDTVWALAIDPYGRAVIGGFTRSPDFPLQAPLQAAAGGGTFDAFLAVLDSYGSSLVFSTYVGGSGDDVAYAVALNSANQVYIAGYTQSPDFPGANGFTSLGDAAAYVMQYSGPWQTTPVAVSVSPASASLAAGQTRQFTATVSNTGNTAVNWTLSPNLGTIGSTGLYTAPATVASQQTVTVTAASVADTTKSASASITLTPPVAVSVSPSSASLAAGQTQQFTATVSNTSNTAVSWTLSPNLGTIGSTGLYTAPATVASQQTVTVTAASVADTTKSASASITLTPPVAVSVSPSSASLAAGQTRQFTATVSNTSNTAVSWTLSPNLGTIGSTGLYTAPATVASQQTVTVTAASVADTTKSASASITLTPPAAPPVVVPPVVTPPASLVVTTLAGAALPASGITINLTKAASGSVGAGSAAVQLAANGGTLALASIRQGSVSNAALTLTWTSIAVVTAAPQNFTVTAPATSGVLPGSYATSVIITDVFGNITTIPVTINVVGASGNSQIGVFRGGPGIYATFALDVNGNYAYDGGIDKFIGFGLAGDQPVAAKFFATANGGGDQTVHLGVFRNGTWYIDKNNNGIWDSGDQIWYFGLPGDQAVVGDWTGDGIPKIGVFRNGIWYLDAGNKHAWDPATAVIAAFGLPGDIAVVSNNWLSASTIDRIGVFRCPVGGGSCAWIVDSNGDRAWQPTDAVFYYGLKGDKPMVGNWNGTGVNRIGVFRGGTLILDTNGNNAWDPSDQVGSFGLPGDLPVIGNWSDIPRSGS